MSNVSQDSAHDVAAPAMNNVTSPPGRVDGSFKIIDGVTGKVKGYGVLGGQATPEQVKAIFGEDALNPKQ